MPRIAATALTALAALSLAACGDDGEEKFVACLQGAGGKPVDRQEQVAGLRFAESGPGVAVEKLTYTSALAYRGPGREARLLVVTGATGLDEDQLLRRIREDVGSLDDALLLPWSDDPTGPTERCQDVAAPGEVFP